MEPTGGSPVHNPIIIQQPLNKMNQLESSYASVLNAQLMSGLVADYMFCPLKFRLADMTTYTPDFLVIRPGGSDGAWILELHEVKGFMRDDANVKLKVAAEMYPWFSWHLVTRTHGEWKIVRVGG
jgi:hypothetical protein